MSVTYNYITLTYSGGVWTATFTGYMGRISYWVKTGPSPNGVYTYQSGETTVTSVVVNGLT